jgi:hypothetical protein
VPKDDLGSFLGPGRANAFRIVPDQGRMDGPLSDLGDGRYRQVLVPPRGVPASDVAIALETVAPWADVVEDTEDALEAMPALLQVPCSQANGLTFAPASAAFPG